MNYPRTDRRNSIMSLFKFPHIEETSLRIKALRYFMTIFCTFFLFFGFSVILCGALLTSSRPDECPFLSRFYTGVYLLLAAGCATTFFSIVACFHAQRSTSAQDFYSVSVVVIIVLVMQIFAAVACDLFYNFASNGDLESGMNSTWQAYYNEGMGCVNALQEKFECCGVNSPTEWLFLSVNASSDFPYPSSCLCASNPELREQCVLMNSTLANNSYTLYVHKTSCHDVLLSDLYHTLLIPRILGPILSVVEFVLVLAALYFLHHLHNHSLVGAYVVTSPQPRTEDAQVSSGSACPNGAEFGAEPGACHLELGGRPPTPPLSIEVSQKDSLSVSQDETTCWNETVMHV